MSEYAIAEIGSKQYKLEKGQRLAVDQINIAEKEVITFDNIPLYVSDDTVKIGKPYLGYSIKAKVIQHMQGKKTQGMKYKPGGYRRKFGQRQKLTEIEITDIIKKSSRTKTKSKSEEKTDS